MIFFVAKILIWHSGIFINRVVELEEQIKKEKDQADLLLEQQRLVWHSCVFCLCILPIDQRT